MVIEPVPMGMRNALLVRINLPKAQGVIMHTLSIAMRFQDMRMFLAN